MHPQDIFWSTNVQVTFQFTSYSCSHAHGAALALWDLCGLAVTYILTHHVLTNHRAHIAYTDSTWLWVPYLIVGVDFAILCTGIFIKKNSNWHQYLRLLFVSLYHTIFLLSLPLCKKTQSSKISHALLTRLVSQNHWLDLDAARTLEQTQLSEEWINCSTSYLWSPRVLICNGRHFCWVFRTWFQWKQLKKLAKYSKHSCHLCYDILTVDTKKCKRQQDKKMMGWNTKIANKKDGLNFSTVRGEIDSIILIWNSLKQMKIHINTPNVDF